MTYKASESEKTAAYQRGFEDGKEGEFSPPKGDGFVDFFTAPIDALAGTPSTRDVAYATSESYRDGHKAGSGR